MGESSKEVEGLFDEREPRNRIPDEAHVGLDSESDYVAECPYSLGYLWIHLLTVSF